MIFGQFDRLRTVFLLIIVFAFGFSTIANAADQPKNPSGLNVPRYASLKSDRVNVRKGPGSQYPIAWVFQRTSLPVEVVKEFENWRQIRDSDGTTGWVLNSLLSGRRTAVLSPWDLKKTTEAGAEPATISIFGAASKSAAIMAYAETGTLVDVVSCDKAWCRVSVSGQRGYVEQTLLWGVYPDEVVE